MRKYTGKYPNHIREIYSSFAPGIAMVKTNNGGTYYIHAKLDSMPEINEDIFSYKFTRAQPMTFQQDGTRFHRMLDGYALPFAEYQWPLHLVVAVSQDEVHKDTRRAFIHDMAKQGILPRFT